MEMVAVIAIVAILLALLVPSIMGHLRDTKALACQANLSTIGKEYLLKLATSSQARLQSDYQSMLDEAMAAHGGSPTVALSYQGICPSDGIVSGVIGPMGAVQLFCSVHGGQTENDFIPFLLSQSGALKTYFEEKLNSSKLKQGCSLNSEAAFTGATAPAIWDELEKQGILRTENSWRVYIKSKAGSIDQPDTYNIFWSYTNIGALSVGQVIPVTRYDAITGQYVKGTARVASINEGSPTYYNIIDGESFTPDETS